MVVSFLFLRRINTVYVKDENLSLNKDEFFKGKLLVKNIKTIFFS